MYYELLFNTGAGNGMVKLAGEADTLKGNILSATVPFATWNKSKERGEGVGGYLARSTAQLAGGTATGAGLQALSDKFIIPRMIASKNETVSNLGKELSKPLIDKATGKIAKGKIATLPLTYVMATQVLGNVPGSTVGDRLADYIL